MPRFVFLLHCWPNCPRNAPSARSSCHWDLMFEGEGSLATWSVDSFDLVHFNAQAILLADHRLAYLDYQGPLTGDRGFVRRVLAGEYRIESTTGDSANPQRSAGNRLTAGDYLRLQLGWPSAKHSSTATLELTRVDDDRWNLTLDRQFAGWPQIFRPCPEPQGGITIPDPL